MVTLPNRVDRVICSMPRSGGNMLLSMMTDSGAGTAGEWPTRLPKNATIALVHLHYVSQLQSPPDRAILLYRRNVLAQAVSWAAAYKTGHWTDGQQTGPVHLDSGEVISLTGELHAARQDWIDWLARRSVPTLLVAYEDLLADAKVAGRAVEWFGGDARQLVLPPKTPKQGSWVNDVWVDGAKVALAGYTGDGLDGRIARARMSRGYRTPEGARRDGLS